MSNTRPRLISGPCSDRDGVSHRVSLSSRGWRFDERASGVRHGSMPYVTVTMAYSCPKAGHSSNTSATTDTIGVAVEPFEQAGMMRNTGLWNDGSAQVVERLIRSSGIISFSICLPAPVRRSWCTVYMNMHAWSARYIRGNADPAATIGATLLWVNALFYRVQLAPRRCFLCFL